MNRSIQRRSPGMDGAPSIPSRSISPAVGAGMGSINGGSMQRPSTSSGRSAQNSGGSRRNNPSSNSSNAGSSVPLSQIEKSVTHLLVATKQLLETLTQWSRKEASDTQVSDVYVRLGYEFNMACRAFSAINVDTSDLGNVPELLRTILEATLSQEASADSLDRYLPRIRDIIINLLHGLKRKQQRLRQRQARERETGGNSGSGSGSGSGGSGGGAIANTGDANGVGLGSGAYGSAPGPGPGPAATTMPNRATSTSTMGSNNSGLTTLLNEGIDSNGYRPDLQTDDSRSQTSPSRRYGPRDQSVNSLVSDQTQSSLSSTAMQNIPVMPPYPGDEAMPSANSASDLSSLDNFPPPPPPPKGSQQSALAALQRGGDLERRASRRYSAYQINKHLGPGVAGIPMLPTQTGPIPNRGRAEARESMRAMQVPNNYRHNRNIPGRPGGFDTSPVRIPSRVSEEESEEGSTLRGTDNNSTGPAVPEKNGPPLAAADLNGPMLGPGPTSVPAGGEPQKSRLKEPPPSKRPIMHVRVPTPDKQLQPGSFMLENSPPTASSLSKELTLFLQYKSRVKKFVLPDGFDELSIGRLQLAFIEKFSWNTQQNGVDLPEIYIQDPVSGVRHELEELSDIKDRTVLVLNVEPLDEVKRHIDDGIGSLKKMVQDVRQNMDEQGQALQRVSERQSETAKDVAKLAAAPPPPPPLPPVVAVAPAPAPSTGSPKSGAAPMALSRKAKASQLTELQSLRRDLAVIRQTYSNFQSEVQGSMASLRNKANNIKLAAVKVPVPDVDGDTGHSYVSAGRKHMTADSDRLVGQVDDLQDLVEDLRKDVVHRGVRPLPRQLETVSRDITALTKELKKMEDFMRREKPVWTKIWEKELEDVCNGRDELRLMEDLIVDLKDDLEKASETFALVEQATKEQMKDAGAGVPAGPGAAGSNMMAGGGGAPGGAPGASNPTAPSGVGQFPSLRQVSNGAGGRALQNGNLTFLAMGGAAAADPAAAKEGVLGEVRALQPNHRDRLEAIERAEKLRQKELESRRDDPMKRELAEFVGEGKLKKSGGVEEVERVRLAREERVRREVWERMNGVAGEEEEEEEEEEEGEEGEEEVEEEEEGGEEEDGEERGGDAGDRRRGGRGEGTREASMEAGHERRPTS